MERSVQVINKPTTGKTKISLHRHIWLNINRFLKMTPISGSKPLIMDISADKLLYRHENVRFFVLTGMLTHDRS